MKLKNRREYICVYRQRYNLTVLEIRTVFSGGQMHFDVVERFALAQIVVIGGGQQARSVTPHDRLEVPAVNVERKGFESVHDDDEDDSNRSERLINWREKLETPSR